MPLLPWATITSERLMRRRLLVADMYRLGIGGRQDADQARKWYEKVCQSLLLIPAGWLTIRHLA